MSDRIKRRSFTLQEKQAIVLDWQTDPTISVRKVAEKYQIRASSSIVKWSKSEKLFRNGLPLELGSAADKKTLHPGPPLKRQELEVYLHEFWQSLREQGKPVDVNLLVTETVRIHREQGIPGLPFDTVKGIIHRFMKRYNLRYRATTHTGKFIDEAEMSATILDFVQGFRFLKQSLRIASSRIFNMDQTAVYFDNAPKKTLAKRGSRSVSITTGNNSSQRVTVFLCVSFSGVKLPPFIVFKATRDKTVHNQVKTIEKGGYSTNCSYTVQHNGWCDQDSMNDWIDLFGESIDKSGLSLLLLDNFSVHCTQQTHSRLASHNTCIEMLPPNYTSKLQPLDVGLNKPFKDGLKRLFIHEAAKTPAGEKLTVTRQLISHWIAKAWNDIPVSAILNTVEGIGYEDRR